MVRRCDLARAEALLAEDEPPEGWEDEAEAAPREDELDDADEPADDRG
jgi:hypothetical protein